jgi:outer membrane autotransporter protein
MKKFLPPLLLAAVVLPSIPASAEPLGVYVAPRLSASLVQFHFKAPAYDNWSYGSHEEWTYGGALAVGYDFHPSHKVPVRVELEYDKLSDVERSKKYDGGWWKAKSTLGVSTLFVNTYFDFHNRSAFTPYVSLGVGKSFLSAKMTETDYIDPDDNYVYGKKTTTNTAWNIGLGSALRLSETISLDLGYRYSHLGKARTKSHEYDESDYAKSKNVETHQLIFGAKFMF